LVKRKRESEELLQFKNNEISHFKDNKGQVHGGHFVTLCLSVDQDHRCRSILSKLNQLGFRLINGSAQDALDDLAQGQL
jgi:hypothetical protein